MSSHPNSNAGNYCELHSHSCYSLLDGVPTPQQLLDRAAQLGLPALALTDHDAVYGLAAFQVHAQAIGLKPILGAELTLEDGTHLTLLAETNTGYANLCRLITTSRNATGAAKLAWRDLQAHTAGLICLTGCRRGALAQSVAANDLGAAQSWLGYLLRLFGPDHLYVELQRNLNREDVRISRRLAALATERHLPYVATGNVHYLDAQDVPLQAALVSIRQQTPLPQAGNLLRPTHDYFMRSPRYMQDLFADLPEAIANTQRIADRCQAQLPSGAGLLPTFAVPQAMEANDYLREICLPQLSRFYPQNRDQACARLEGELAAIRQRGLANYFLIAADIASFCQKHGILYQAQGTTAHTVTARLLGLGNIGPHLAPASPYPSTADFDLEVDATQRESVLHYIQQRWGAAHTGAAGKFVTIHAASAIREAGFALGFAPQAVHAVAASLAGELLPEAPVELDPPDLPIAHLARYQSSSAEEQAKVTNLTTAQRQQLLKLAGQLQGRPRALAMDAGSLILTERPLEELLPLEQVNASGQAAIQLDKQGLQALGLVHVGLQGSTMLAAIASTLNLIRQSKQIDVDLQNLTLDESAVYDLIASARTVGLLQQPATRPTEPLPHFQSHAYEDLVVEASLILQPSLLRSGMVQHYLRRRQGLEPVVYVVPLLQPILQDTLGVLVFQEQALQIVSSLAGFGQPQTELFRRALNHSQAAEAVKPFRSQFIEGSLCNNIPFETADQVWNMLLVFADCALSKARGTALATLVYWAAWLRLYYPAEYFCALLGQVTVGSHPAGVLAAEAGRAGVPVLPCHINRSQALPSLEQGSIRLGLQHVNGIDSTVSHTILQARGDQPFRSLADLIQRTGLERRAMEWLILAGVLDSLGYRPHLLWELAEAFNVAHRTEPALPAELDETADFDDLIDEPALFMRFAATSRTARMRLTELRRDAFTKAGCLVWQQLRKARVGAKVKVGGLVIEAAQRPAAARGAAFLRIDEPEGSIQVTVPENVYLEDREALRSAFLVIEGTVQSQGASVSIVARRVMALT